MSVGVRKNVVSRRSDIKYEIYVTQQLYISLFLEFFHLSILEILTKDMEQCCLNNNIRAFLKVFKQERIPFHYFHVNIICIKLPLIFCVICLVTCESSDNMKSTILDRDARIKGTGENRVNRRGVVHPTSRRTGG